MLWEHSGCGRLAAWSSGIRGCAAIVGKNSLVTTFLNASAKLQQAEALMEQGQLDEPRAKVQEELSQHPSSVEGYNLLGIIATSQQDYAGGEAASSRHSRSRRTPSKTHINLGNVYVAEKKPDLAENEFRTVLRLDPANADGNYNLGVLLMAKGSAAEAIPHFERVRPPNVATT